MSGKATVFLTRMNEHWHTDCHENDAFIMEISEEHTIEQNSDGGVIITIKPGSELDAILKKASGALSRAADECFPRGDDGIVRIYV